MNTSVSGREKKKKVEAYNQKRLKTRGDQARDKEI